MFESELILDSAAATLVFIWGRSKLRSQLELVSKVKEQRCVVVIGAVELPLFFLNVKSAGL